MSSYPPVPDDGSPAAGESFLNASTAIRMKVADATTPIESTLRPGRYFVLRRPSRETAHHPRPRMCPRDEVRKK